MLKYKIAIQNANYFLCLLFIFWLPLKDEYLPLIMALWIFTWLLEGNFKNRFSFFSINPLFISLIIFFSFTILYIFRANDFEYGFFQVQQKLSLVFFPLILAGSSNKIKDNYKMILLVFILGNLVASFYCLIYTFIDCLKIENGSYTINYFITPGNYKETFWELINLRYNRFSYNYLSIFIHPSYFSMFLVFSIVTIVYFFKKGLIVKNWTKIASVLIILFFIFMLYLLQSRAAFIAFSLVIVLIPLVELKKKFKKRFIFITIALLIAALTFVSTSSKIKSNLHDLVEFTRSENKKELLNSDIRLQLWYTSIEIIEENFWFGTSPANLTDELVKKYKELGFEKAADDELNTHSQYLESFAGLGIFGFLALMFIITYTFIISIKQKHYLLFFLMVILSINFLFEAMLNRMAGLLFMMFFISLFVFAKNNGTIENKIKVAND